MGNDSFTVLCVTLCLQVLADRQKQIEDQLEVVKAKQVDWMKRHPVSVTAL